MRRRRRRKKTVAVHNSGPSRRARKRTRRWHARGLRDLRSGWKFDTLQKYKPCDRGMNCIAPDRVNCGILLDEHQTTVKNMVRSSECYYQFNVVLHIPSLCIQIFVMDSIRVIPQRPSARPPDRAIARVHSRPRPSLFGLWSGRLLDTRRMSVEHWSCSGIPG